MNVIDRIKATQDRNRKELEALAHLTDQTVAEVEADVCAPDQVQGPHRPDECLACELHKVTMAWGIFALAPSVPIHWCTET